ncbi:glycosyltransferase, partial [Bordetella pertussis]|uniref:glycosyltransferase n=1 Tax=Bordetella pertussis TaxID=520 RepID=UPI000A80A795
MSAPTILIMAGGTGGHIMPGLAVAEVLRERGWRVLWLGNPDKMEGRLVPPRGIELVPLRFQGVGYVAFPGGVMAALRRTPLVVHEQNAVAGTA